MNAAFMNRTLFTTLAATAAAVVLLLAGCAQPGPAATPLAQRSAADAGLVDAAATPLPDAQWWRAWGDPALDALVARALEGQPSLQAAAARVARSQAGVASAQALSRPSLGLAADAVDQRYSGNYIYPPPLGGSTRDSYTLQASGSFELDFFGRHEAALKSALGQQRAAQAEAQAARNLIATQVVRGWVGLARLIEQRQVATRTLALREQVLGLTRERQKAGLDTTADLRQAEGSPPELRAQIEALDEQIALARHQLAALSGQAPQALAAAAPVLAPLQAATPPEQLGVDLLGRRPDVVAAGWRVEAATQDVALARKAFLPDVNLMAFAGLQSLSWPNFLDAGSRNLGVDVAVRLPLFDSGRLQANLSGREAEVDAAIAAYNGAVLDAVREAADAAVSLRSLARQQREQAQALAAVEGALDVALQRYRAGLGGTLPVLVVEGQVLAQRRAAVDLKARVLDTQAQLMRALGGGWQADAQATQNKTAG